MRFVYIFLIYVLSPVAILLMLWRGLRSPAYREKFPQRFGFLGFQLDQDSIWVHAVSVGEVQAASPMIRRLLDAHPDVPMVVSTVTPTGAQRVRDIFGDRVQHCYAPYDLPGSVKRFFNRARPKVAVIMETELWPNLFHQCGHRKVPLILANARISPRSVRKYRWFTGLFGGALSHGIVIAAQSKKDAERFESLGASPDRTHVVGNIKFDMDLPADRLDEGRRLREAHSPGRPVWLAASTHEGEESIMLDAMLTIRQRFPAALLILVPRHPERFSGVSILVSDKYGFVLNTRSKDRVFDEYCEVFLVDTVGELPTFFSSADIAFVGGSLVPVGGHNLLEPAAAGIPIITGPHTFNAEEVNQLLLDAGAVETVHGADGLANQVIHCFSNPNECKAKGAKGLAVLQRNRGALDRLLDLLEPLIR
ncbi:MAG: lipid IV(A) 3-deoxy-D-manno-octulosonic acid transferase [Pseudomonadota bacterium]